MSDELELLRRELCPDGSCIGVVGSDGRCKECGKVGASVTTHARNRNLRPPSADSDEPTVAALDRQLCPDGACLGVLDADGRCRECGAVAGQAASAPGASTSAPPVGSIVADVGTDDDFEQRELCADGSCIGLIGPERRCRVCSGPPA